jgi:hypothetical protein
MRPTHSGPRPDAARPPSLASIVLTTLLLPVGLVAGVATGLWLWELLAALEPTDPAVLAVGALLLSLLYPRTRRALTTRLPTPQPTIRWQAS